MRFNVGGARDVGIGGVYGDSREAPAGHGHKSHQPGTGDQSQYGTPLSALRDTTGGAESISEADQTGWVPGLPTLAG